MKRIIKHICLISALVLILNTVSSVSFAADGKEDELVFVEYPGYNVESEEYPGLVFLIYGTRAIVQSYTGEAAELDIPDNVNGYPVLEINSSCFYNNTVVEAVTFPDTIWTSGSGIFKGCTNLKYVKLSEGLTELAAESFMGCSSLESITIPDSVEYIEKDCFKNCTALKNVRLSATMTYIDDSFADCSSLENINIPRSVSVISPYAFINCDSFSEFTVDEENESFKAIDGVLYSRDGTRLISYPQARAAESYEIPDGVAAIGKMAFYRAYGLTRLRIPDTVTEIGDQAFQFCVYLTDISVPDSVEKLGGFILDNTGWFYAQPDGIVYMNDSVYSFKGELPETVAIRDGTVKIYPNAFIRRDYYLFVDNEFIRVQLNAYNMKHIVFPDSLRSIGEYAFSVCGLEELNVPDSVTEIGDCAFYMSRSLTEVVIGDGVRKIGSDAFTDCDKVRKLTVGSGLREVGESVFCGLHDLTELELKYGITELGWYMFEYCNSLKSVKIPASVKKIDYEAFYMCGELSEIEFPDTLIEVNRTAFKDTAWFDDQPDGIVYTGRNAYAIKGAIPTDVVLADGTVSTTWSWLFLQQKEFGNNNVIIPEGYPVLKNATFHLDDSCTITIPSGVADIYADSIMDTYAKKKPMIRGFTGSAAELFAAERGCTFIPIGVETSDSETGIEIGLKNGESLTVASVDENRLPERLPHGGAVLNAYDIGLTKDGESARLEYKTSVKIPCENENAKVYYISDSGAVIDMKAVYYGGYLIFAADSTGVYVTAELPDEEPYILGDVDNDSEVNVIDATFLQRYCINVPIVHVDTVMQGDVDFDGVVSIVDATYIQRSDLRVGTPYNIGDKL